MTTLMQMPDGRLIRKFVALFVCFLVNDDDGDFLSFFLSLSLWCVCVCVCVCVFYSCDESDIRHDVHHHHHHHHHHLDVWMYG